MKYICKVCGEEDQAETFEEIVKNKKECGEGISNRHLRAMRAYSKLERNKVKALKRRQKDAKK